MLTALVVLAVLGILFGAAALATYEGDVLRDPAPDDRDAALPPGAVQPEDVQELRFDLALRGYRMAEVDAAMARLAAELADRDTRIAQLEQALVAIPEPAVETWEEAPQVAEPVEPPEPVEESPAAVEAYAPLEPPAVAPASISGPLTATTWFTEPAPEPEPEPEPAFEPEYEEPEPEYEPEPEPEPEPEDLPALTLPAADDAFSFPELQPPDQAPLPEDERPDDGPTAP